MCSQLNNSALEYIKWFPVIFYIFMNYLNISFILSIVSPEMSSETDHDLIKIFAPASTTTCPNPEHDGLYNNII